MKNKNKCLNKQQLNNNDTDIYIYKNKVTIQIFPLNQTTKPTCDIVLGKHSDFSTLSYHSHKLNRIAKWNKISQKKKVITMT
jgi:hypothetical protein